MMRVSPSMVTLAALILLCSGLVFTSHAFVIRPVHIAPIAKAKPGAFLWKPSAPVVLSTQSAAVRVSLASDACDGRTERCPFGIAFTTDGGQTFHLDERAEVSTFCGAGGVVKKAAKEGVEGSEEGASAQAPASIVCISEQLVDDGNETALTYTTKEYVFTPGSPTVEVKEHTEHAVFEHPPQLPEPTSLFPGDTVAVFSGHNGTLGRNVELVLSNGTVLHAFYRSDDGGKSWSFASVIPFPIGSDSAIHVLGPTKAMIIAGEPNNLKQAVTVFLGSRWEKIENVSYVTPLSTFTSNHSTTVYGGLRGRPGLVGMAAGRKRGSEKLLDFAALHNKVAERLRSEGHDFGGHAVTNYSGEFLNATVFGDCRDPATASDASGCATSSFTSIFALGNGSDVFALYDKLEGGYAPATDSASHTLYVMRLALNETKEQKEADDKRKEDELAQERARQAELAREKAREELKQRKAEERRAKLRADKKRRAAFREGDQVNVDAAKAAFAADKDPIIVRPVITEDLEFERDTFFDDFPSTEL